LSLAACAAEATPKRRAAAIANLVFDNMLHLLFSPPKRTNAISLGSAAALVPRTAIDGMLDRRRQAEGGDNFSASAPEVVCGNSVGD
jgi:hypothetical protein